MRKGDAQAGNWRFWEQHSFKSLEICGLYFEVTMQFSGNMVDLESTRC